MALGNNNGFRLRGIGCARALSVLTSESKLEAHRGAWLNPGMAATGVVQGGAANTNGYADGTPERSASTSAGSDLRGGVVIVHASAAIIVASPAREGHNLTRARAA